MSAQHRPEPNQSEPNQPEQNQSASGHRNERHFAEPVNAESLVREHIGWMLALAQRMLGDHALAEDVVQEAFINAFRALDNFEQRASIKTWLHRITVNAALMKLRQLKRLAEQPIDDLLPEFDRYDCRLEAPWKKLATVESILADEQRRNLIHKKIQQLPDSYRIVLLLRDIEDYTTSEVAELLAISEANVKIRLHRARTALKKLLEPVLRGEVIE